MAKIKVNDQGLEQGSPSGDRQARWEAYIENYSRTNPVKYAAKRSTTYTELVNGKEVTKEKVDEFAEIPPSFV